jgi:hypothetical protein
MSRAAIGQRDSRYSNSEYLPRVESYTLRRDCSRPGTHMEDPA